MNTMPLTEAGYRERIFVKSELARLGQLDKWAATLEQSTYNPHRDAVYNVPGRSTPMVVLREGTASVEVLHKHAPDASTDV